MGMDPVVWYSFGITHSPRVEDFPVMPVEMVGFTLKPEGFFRYTGKDWLNFKRTRNNMGEGEPMKICSYLLCRGNPSVDVPSERNMLSVEHKARTESAECCMPKAIMSRL